MTAICLNSFIHISFLNNYASSHSLAINILGTSAMKVAKKNAPEEKSCTSDASGGGDGSRYIKYIEMPKSTSQRA